MKHVLIYYAVAIFICLYLSILSMYEIGREPVSLTLTCHYNLFNFSSFHILIFVWTKSIILHTFTCIFYIYAIYICFNIRILFLTERIYLSIYLSPASELHALPEGLLFIYLSIYLSSHIYIYVFISFVYFQFWNSHPLPEGLLRSYLSIYPSIYLITNLSFYLCLYLCIYIFYLF